MELGIQSKEDMIVAGAICAGVDGVESLTFEAGRQHGAGC